MCRDSHSAYVCWYLSVVWSLTEEQVTRLLNITVNEIEFSRVEFVKWASAQLFSVRFFSPPDEILPESIQETTVQDLMMYCGYFGYESIYDCPQLHTALSNLHWWYHAMNLKAVLRVLFLKVSKSLAISMRGPEKKQGTSELRVVKEL